VCSLQSRAHPDYDHISGRFEDTAFPAVVPDVVVESVREIVTQVGVSDKTLMELSPVGLFPFLVKTRLKSTGVESGGLTQIQVNDQKFLLAARHERHQVSLRIDHAGR